MPALVARFGMLNLKLCDKFFTNSGKILERRGSKFNDLVWKALGLEALWSKCRNFLELLLFITV